MSDAAEAPIFVLASGPRCGSTLLQRLLNSHPDVMIWGEQGGFLNHFTANVRSLVEWERTYRHQRNDFLDRGYGVFTANLLPEAREIDAAVATFLHALIAEPARRIGRTRWGCKETRCGADVAAFIGERFPGARFVHLTRDPVDCVRSLLEWEATSPGWDRPATEAALDDWARVNASFLATPNLAATMTVRYEDLVADPRVSAAAIAAHLYLDAAAFDPGVFDRRIHWSGPWGEAPRSVPAREDLTEADLATLRRPPLPEVAAALGYDLDR